MKNPFLILGIDENASEMQIEEAFRYLNKALAAGNFEAESAAAQQAAVCLSKIVPAYKALHDSNTRDLARADAIAERGKPFDGAEFKAFLGHICVAAGIITIADLDEAIAKQSDIDLPLGQILQERKLLSQTELEGLLMGQRLYGAPARPPDKLCMRLMALGAVSKDMVKIALIDLRTNFMSTIPQLLVRRGWLTEPVLQALADQGAKQASMPS